MDVVALNVYVKVVMPLISPVVRFRNFIFSLPLVKTKEMRYYGTAVCINRHWIASISFNGERATILATDTPATL